MRFDDPNMESYLSEIGGWTNSFEKYDRQIGNLPQVRVTIKTIWNHQLAMKRHVTQNDVPSGKLT